MPENEGIAVAWISGLRARGVAVTLGPSGRIRMHPASAYGALSDEELLTLRHHRQAIKDAVRAGLPVSVEGGSRPEPTTLVPAPEPARCPHCARLRAECDGLRASHPEVWAVVCSRHPDARKAKDNHDTQEMFESWRRHGLTPYWP